MKGIKNFKKKKISEIRAWAWAAAVVPLVSLSAIFFVWYLGTETWFDRMMIVVATSFFAVGVVWWWWTLHVLKSMIQRWDDTGTKVRTVIDEIRELKVIFQEILFGRDTDK